VQAARLHALIQVRLSLLPRCGVTLKHTQYPLTFLTCACSYLDSLRRHEHRDHGIPRYVNNMCTTEFRRAIDSCHIVRCQLFHLAQIIHTHMDQDKLDN
jgi:hypothetical protein